jgi:hypothetical protein
MATKKYFFRFGKFPIKDGLDIWLWEDRWLGSATLPEQYLTLYNIVHRKHVTFAKVMETSPSNVTFRRDLSRQRLVASNVLLQHLTDIHLQVGSDEFY